MLTKDETARIIADAHFRMDHDVRRIFRVLEDDESNEDRPVKLLEVTELTPEVGIMPIGMPADPGRRVDYSSVIIEITPGEFDRLEHGELALPHGWKMGDELFPSQQAAGVAP